MTKSRNRIEGEGGRVNAGTIATTSGTSVTWSSIPAWVTKIAILISQVSTAGADHLRIQLGTSGGTVTTGYVTDSMIMVHNATSDWVHDSTGFSMFLGNASRTMQGVVKLEKGSDDLWYCYGTTGLPVDEQGAIIGGVVDLSGTLTDVIVNGDNGSAFDNGAITLIYE